MRPRTISVKIFTIQTLASSRTPSAKAIVTATLSLTAMVTQDAQLIRSLVTSRNAPAPMRAHLNALVKNPGNSFLYLKQPAITMNLQTHSVQAVAEAKANALVLAHAPTGIGAKVILAAKPQHYLRP